MTSIVEPLSFKLTDFSKSTTYTDIIQTPTSEELKLTKLRLLTKLQLLVNSDFWFNSDIWFNSDFWSTLTPGSTPTPSPTPTSEELKLINSNFWKVEEDVDNISIQGNDEVKTHGHIDDNLHTQHYKYQQPIGLFTRMLNDDADSTGFYSANERDVRYESYDYSLPIDYNPWHHVIEEHVIEEDEENEIDSQDDCSALEFS
ncbi:hypothetical protein Taro_037337 [Colocasia esculenta]|uniref:Uncharacterized protein n=1 Tax=Colocasia esculenta TaxID=4460 RepID=A0A843W9G6_COLES|nr:hypothetical protein [Colocasia esculenta]